MCWQLVAQILIDMYFFLLKSKSTSIKSNSSDLRKLGMVKNLVRVLVERIFDKDV